MKAYPNVVRTSSVLATLDERAFLTRGETDDVEHVGRGELLVERIRPQPGGLICGKEMTDGDGCVVGSIGSQAR